MKKLFLLAVVSVFVFVGLAPVSVSADTKRYAALGDSVAAGAGLPLKDSAPETLACGRASQAYGATVGASLGTLTHLYACGGATVPQGLAGPQMAGGMTLPSQIDQAYGGGQKPTHITLTVGANDIHWAELVRKCYVSTCGTPEDTLAVAQLQVTLFNNLNGALGKIRQKAGSPQALPKVAVTGYFKPLSTDLPVCADTQGLTTDEIDWLLNQEHLLNRLIQVSTILTGYAHYVPVNFSGHELCSARPWVQGLHDPASYHPNAAGQAAIGRAVLEVF